MTHSMNHGKRLKVLTRVLCLASVAITLATSQVAGSVGAPPKSSLGSSSAPKVVSNSRCRKLVEVAIASPERFSVYELFIAQSWMKHRFSQYPSTISMGFKKATARTGDPNNTGTDVISFGSGPDVFTPLVNFPLAKRIHLVDSWMGWGLGSGEVWKEIILRLYAIHPDVKVTVQEAGFLDLLPDDEKSFIYDLINKGHSDPLVSKKLLQFKIADSSDLLPLMDLPMILNVSWEQEGLGKVSREILIHFAFNYNNSDNLKSLNRHLEYSTIAGIIVEGAPFPEQLYSYLERLDQTGAAILDTYSNNPEMLTLLHKVGRSGQYRIQLVHMETYQRYGEPEPIEQKLFLIQRRKRK